MDCADAPSNVPANPIPPKMSRFPRSLLLASALLVLVGIALAFYFRWKMRRKPLPDDPDEALQVAIEEADRLDPGWRFEEWEAKRAAIADADNSALCILAAHERLPKGWPTWSSLDLLAVRELDQSARYQFETDIRKVPAAVQFNKQQLAVLKGELREAEAALTEARKLADLPQGRLPPGPPSKSAYLGSNPDLSQVRKIMELVEMDARVHAQEGQPGDALASCLAILNAGRAIDDEADSVAHLVRLACQSTAVYTLERTLAQGTPSPAVLTSTQRHLKDEAEAPISIMVVRGERARTDFFLRKIREGAFSSKEMEQIEKMVTSLGCESESSANEEKWYAPTEINWYLRFSTDLVEICKQSEPAPLETLQKRMATLKKQPMFLQLEGSGIGKIVENCWRNRARLRCADVALAVERYRLANGRWSDSLADLVPAQIARIPADSYDGRGLRYCHVRQGVGVYSIGPDGVDDKGDLRDPMANQQAADIGFRLWNTALRRQTPAPEQPLDELRGTEDE